MKIKIGKMAIVVLVLFFGGIFATIATDTWTTTTTKVPVKYTDGEAKGAYNPEDIRGSYTFAEISELFEVDEEILFLAFGIPVGTDATEIQTKDLEEMYSDLSVEVGNESVQVFVALYMKLPITLTDTYLPSPAIDILKSTDIAWDAQQLEYFETYWVDISKSSDAADADHEADETSKETSDNDSEETNIVNGSATFQKVLDAGISKEQIELIIGNKMPPTNQTVKDYCTQNNLSFSEIKDQINALAQ